MVQNAGKESQLKFQIKLVNNVGNGIFIVKGGIIIYLQIF